jgi:hypothetical protein
MLAQRLAGVFVTKQAALRRIGTTCSVNTQSRPVAMAA